MSCQRGLCHSLQRLAGTRMMTSIVHFTLVAVLIFIIIIHMEWEQHPFMADSTSRDEKTLIRRLPARNQTSEQQHPTLSGDGMKLIPAQTSSTEKAAEHSKDGLISLETAEKPINLILVSSNPRSGSSFLGGLLSSPLQALYLYEPFWYYSHYKRPIKKHLVDPEANEIVKRDLHRLLECRISEIPGMFDTRLHMKIWKRPTMLAPLTVKQRTSICQDLKLRVIKVIRAKLSSVLPLLKIPELNAHIIHLVRDPRAVVNSVSKFEGWSKFLTPSKACVVLRNDIEASLDFAEHPRLLRVRYEDVVARPDEASLRIFNWLGLKLPPEVHQFLDLHTRQSNRPRSTGNETQSSDSTSSSSSHSSTAVPSHTADTANAAGNAAASAGAETPSNSASVTSSNQNVTSSASEPTTTITRRTVPPAQFSNFYGTIRDANFDGLHWLKSLDKKVRKEAETVCKDVLQHLNYPLVYPQERLATNKTRATKTV